jgi:hypothetical protein
LRTSLELHGVVLGIGASERVEHDLARGAVVGAKARIDAVGHGGLREAVKYFLAGGECGDVVVVDHGDHRKSGE